MPILFEVRAMTFYKLFTFIDDLLLIAHLRFILFVQDLKLRKLLRLYRRQGRQIDDLFVKNQNLLAKQIEMISKYGRGTMLANQVIDQGDGVQCHGDSPVLLMNDQDHPAKSALGT
jgi:hypothetical protein